MLPSPAPDAHIQKHTAQYPPVSRAVLVHRLPQLSLEEGEVVEAVLVDLADLVDIRKEVG